MYVYLTLFLMVQGAGPEAVSEGALAEVAATPWWAPLGGRVVLDNVVGVGTFVPGRNTDNPYYASALTLTPSWALSESLSLNLYSLLTYEWTYLATPCHPASGPRASGAPKQDCSDADGSDGNRFDQEDLQVGLQHSRLLELGPVIMGAQGLVALPTSRISRFTGNLFTLGAQGSANATFGPVAFYFNLSLRKFFPSATAAVLEQAEVDAKRGDGLAIGNCASFRQSSCLLLSGYVPTWRIGSDLTASITPPPLPELTISVTFGYYYTRRYGGPDDGLRAVTTDDEGAPIADGVNADDLTLGAIDLSYWLDDHFAVSLGTFSLQPARTADGKALRFPFYDFISPANNFTTWYLSGTVSL
jgi:hypothetical protein